MRRGVFTPNPSLLFAAAVLLDLIYDSFERELPKEQLSGFWPEWVAWTILLVIYRVIPTLRRSTASSALEEEEARSQETIFCEKRFQDTSTRSTAWALYALSVCLVGEGFLWRSDPRKYNWALVSSMDESSIIRACGSLWET